MNQVILIGRLTADPRINDRITCASFNLAVGRKYKKEGEQSADFISCKMLGEKSAMFANKYLRKGIKVAVIGRIQTGSYTKRDGTKEYTTEIIVDSVEFVESKAASQQNTQDIPKPVSDSDESFMQIPDGAFDDSPFN